MEYFSFNFVLFCNNTKAAGHALDDGWKASKRELLHLLNCFLNNYDLEGVDDDQDVDCEDYDRQDHDDLEDSDDQNKGFSR